MVEFLFDSRPVIISKRAADLRQHLGGADRARPLLGIGQQLRQALALMGMGDGAT
jgi:hypothetical protein